MKLISIDLGAKGAFAFIENGNIVKTTDIPASAKEFTSLLSWADMIVSEDFLRIKQRGTFKNAQNLERVRFACEMLDTPFGEPIKAVSWKAFYGLMNKGRSPLRKKIVKDNSITKVKELYNWNCPRHDHADAILIGMFWLKKNELNQKR